MRTQQPLVLARITTIGPRVCETSVYGPAVRALLLFFSRILVRRTACVRRTWVRFLVLFGGAMVLIRLSMALPFFSLVFRGQRFSFQAFRCPHIIEDGSRRSVQDWPADLCTAGLGSSDLWSTAGSFSPFAGSPAMGLIGP
jgi:hypothetical protein